LLAVFHSGIVSLSETSSRARLVLRCMERDRLYMRRNILLHLVLAAHPSDFYVALMKFAAPLNLAFLLLLALFFPPTFAQGLQVDAEEFKRMAGEVADLKDANQAHQRRIRELTMQIESLRSSLR